MTLKERFIAYPELLWQIESLKSYCKSIKRLIETDPSPGNYESLSQTQERIDELESEKLLLERMIRGLGPAQSRLMEFRYMKQFGWDKISMWIHYSRSHCFRLHRAAMKNLEYAEPKIKPSMS